MLGASSVQIPFRAIRHYVVAQSLEKTVLFKALTKNLREDLSGLMEMGHFKA